MRRVVYFLISLLIYINVQAQEYVDLGLSVNWATYNVGATSVEELGTPFFDGTTTVWENGKNMSRTNAVQNFKDFSGNSEYDAATANWGSGWRTPTLAEWKELVKRCKIRNSKIVASDGTKIFGLTFIGPNGNAIFLHNTPPVPKMGGIYQSSTPNKMGYVWAWWLDGIIVYNPHNAKDMGIYVRPVINK